MPDLMRPDAKLHYEVSGQGPPLLMLAGMMSDSASWAPLLPLLENSFTLIRPDNRTTGRTTPWDAPVSLAIFAEDARAVMQDAGHAKYHVVGHSLGGLIALEMLCQDPQAIATTTVLATAPMRLRRNIALFETLITIRQSNAPEDTWLRALFPWLFSTALYDTPGAIDEAVAASLAYPFAQSAEAMAHQLSALGTVNVERLCGPFNGPVQALLAQNDQMIPLKDAQAALAGAQVHVIERAGHSIHWDAPHYVAGKIKAFCTGP